MILTIAGFFFLFATIGIVLSFLGALPLFLLIFLAYGWVLFAFFHYRFGRQDEFLHLLTTAVEADAPLAPALRAYLEDRPLGPLREAWVGLLLFFVLPGYYWIWYKRNNYDAKVARVAGFLEQGYSLSTALEASPGVVPRQTFLAAAVGESTGRLASCLRNSRSPGFGPLWLEIFPRMFYPLLLLFFINGILYFWMVYLNPRMVRICQEFDMELPDVTKHVIALGDWLTDNGELMFLGFLALGAVVGLLLVSSTFRWYCPIFGRFYRRNAQSRFLKMLAPLLETGQPVPQALDLLLQSGYFSRAVQRRLETIRFRVKQGEPLAESLRRGKLLLPAMVPLVKAAEQVRNLPWALIELGDTLSQSLIRRLRRISVVLALLILIVIGGLVGIMALGMFLPLIELITRLSE
ncbi:MAG TPA: type II secretion system F family protein [Gemmataceae bacterium]|nr:type II secretion system F family protein [Gemmataceae bacterium]